jgi:hypothetical protein
MRQSIKFGNRFSIKTADLLCIIFLLLLPPIFFWRETIGWLTLGEADILFWFFPIWKLAVEQISHGQLPLWNPYLYSGTALFAEWQPGLLDPLNWIHLLGPTSRTLTIAQEVTFSIALLGTFGFTRRLGLERRACLVSAVIYGLSGYVVARTIYPGLFHISAIMPLVLWSIERLYQLGHWQDVASGALIVAWQILAAHPQPFIYSSLLAAAYVLFCATLRGDQETNKLLNRPGTVAARLRFLTQATLMFAAGTALSAVQLMPAWEVAGQSVRQQVPYQFFTWHSIHPITLLTTIIPFFHGQGKAIYQLPYWGAYWHHNEAQIYLGVLAISLALAAAVGLWRERTRSVLFWSLVAIAALLLALGKYIGPLAWAIYRIPLLNQFRSPNRHWMEVTFAVAILAGYAVSRLLRGESQVPGRITLIVAMALTLTSAGTGLFILWRRDRAEALIRALPDMSFLPMGFLRQAGMEFYLPIITATLLFATLFIFARAKNRERWYFLLLASLIIDFNLYATFAPINNQHKLETLVGKSMPPELAARQGELNPLRYHLMLNPQEGSFNPFWFYGSEMVTGYDPLINVRYLTFSGINEAGRSTLPTLLDARDRTLDLLNTKYVLIPAPMLNPPAAVGEQSEYDGITFINDPSSQIELRAGQRANFSAGDAAADTLAIISTMTNSTDAANGDEVAEITIGCESGERAMATLRAGSHTAEWAYDSPDVRARVNHSRAPLAESWPGNESGNFQAHSYLGRISLPPGVARCGKTRFIQIASKARGNLTIVIKQLALYDSTTGLSAPLVNTISGGLRDPSRWREISVNSPDLGYRDLRVFENLKALPRVWLVDRAEPQPDLSQLQLIRGEMVEAREEIFDPLKTALIDPQDAAKLDPRLLESGEKKAGVEEPEMAGAPVSITKREPGRMLITADVTRPSVLVLSEVSFPGWRARIDGHEVELLRVDYLLRGVGLVQGTHTIEFFYWPRSLTRGAAVSAATALFLLGLVIWGRSRRKEEEENTEQTEITEQTESL